MKTCSKCKSSKPATAFSKHRCHADGLSSWCKACCLLQNKYAPSSKIVAKECRQCKVSKPTREFYPNKSFKDGYSSACKACASKRYLRVKSNPDLYKQRLAQNRSRYRTSAKNSRKVWERTLKNRFGLDVWDYALMAVFQENQCAICGRATRRKLCVDHDHSTGRVRGLLCHTCNSALGQFHDSSATLLRAVDYLNRQPS